MQKRIAVYSIAQEKARFSFCAEIAQLDERCVEIVDNHAVVFQSNKTIDELHKLLISNCLQSGDEAWILTLDRPYTGNGITHERLKAFLLK